MLLSLLIQNKFLSGGARGGIRRLYGNGRICRSAILVTTLLLFCSLFASADEDGSQNLSELRGQLEKLGWDVERSPSGDLLLWPPGTTTEQPPAAVAVQAEAAPEKPVAVGDIELLRARLSERGWNLGQSEDGSLLLFPKAMPASPDIPKSDSSESEDRLDGVRALLAASGWKVVRDSGGNLTLYPRTAAKVQSRENTVLQIDSSDLGKLRQALLTAGWRLEQEADGSLILQVDSSVAERVGEGETQGLHSPTVNRVARGEVELPVDSWKKAHRISSAWLGQQPRKDLEIGKIRKINWVYLVSIVENKAPFRLNNQLAIRTDDGSVIPLH